MENNNKMPIRVRFAPSPTGSLHVGGARTALFNYLFAKKMKGSFIIRAEDTDLARSSDDSLKSILKDLQYLGLSWDEGINPDTLDSFGPCGSYKQSERLDIYKGIAKKLIEKGLAYYCFMKDEKTSDDDNSYSNVNSIYRDLSLDDAKARIAQGEIPTIRLKTPLTPKDYVVFDLIRGKVVFSSSMITDFVLIRANGMPTYNFACAVDDHLMNISHVIRASEHLNNTLKQLMIYEAMEVNPPKYAHISLILGPDREKLSKRHGATSVGQFKDDGYLPEALLNYLALLGWSSPKKDQEIISLDEMKELFSLKRINNAPAIFDKAKLNWMNGLYLRKKSLDALKKDLYPFLNGYKFTVVDGDYFYSTAIDLFKVSSPTLKSLADNFKLLTSLDINYTDDAKDVLNWPTTNLVLNKFKDLLNSKISPLSPEDFDNFVTEMKNLGIKGKEVFWPIRVALLGDAHGPEMKTFVGLVSIDESIRRVNLCLKKS